MNVKFSCVALLCLGLSLSCKTIKPGRSAVKSEMASDYDVHFDPGTQFGTWQGWGTSLAWWAAVWGDRDDLADLFFTTKTVKFDNKDVPGLGMNIARYNAGASSNVKANGESIVYGKGMYDTRKVEGFWTDWNSEDPSSSSWNWNADPKQRAMLAKAHDRGANHFELFSNSPMWWMLKNHNPAGASDGSENLQPWNFKTHAVYLATIAKFAKDHWNINFESVDPFNEPSAGWWKADNSQEGCHFSNESMTRIVGYQADELKKRGLDTMISAADENTYDEANDSFPANGNQKLIGRVNVHGYQEQKGRRDRLYRGVQVLDKKPIWLSEYGEDDATGLRLAKNLLMDFQYLHPVAWVYWQVLDGGGWGVVDAWNGDNWLGGPNRKYYVLAQFSRHIREGMKILNSKQGNTVAAYDPANHKLVIVFLNAGPGRWVNFDLKPFAKADGKGGRVRRWSTSISGENADLYWDFNDIEIKDREFHALFGGDMIQTFEIENVDL